jgi:hypothetical protein
MPPTRLPRSGKALRLLIATTQKLPPTGLTIFQANAEMK